jgi:hypothetical protein
MKLQNNDIIAAYLGA